MKPDPLNLVGSLIDGKYKLEEVVGQGGFAVVYKATHQIWKRPVAIKVFCALGELSKEKRERLTSAFIQEGKLLADLSERSAAICQARDIGTLVTPSGEWMPYMVLEWLEGATLEAVLVDEKTQNFPPRSIEETRRLLEPAAEALALAHTKGIAHRDVKPGNIFILGGPRSPDAAVKLLDFGIAKVVNDVQAEGGAFTKTAGHVTSFTPAYGAPEQFSRSYGATGPWTDVFALALIFTEMVSGQATLVGDTLPQLAFMSSNPAQRPTPRSLGVRISDAVEQVFLKALAVKPEERYKSAGEFWNALRHALALAPLQGMRASLPDAIRGDARVSAPPVAPTMNVPDSAMMNSTTLDPAPVAIVSPSLPGALPQGQRNVTTSAPEGRGVAIAVIAAGLGVVIAIGVGIALFAARLNKGEETSTSSSALTSAVPTPSASASAPIVQEATCPEGMVSIPGGKFFMGSDETDALPDERPQHRVSLRPYCMDRFEVTVAAYKACSDAGECKRASRENDFVGLTPADRKAYDPLCNIRDPEGKANHPINCVDWDSAEGFCAAHKKRLPTEAEWEFAARGPDGRKYPWGDEEPTAGYLNACGSECLAWATSHNVELEAMYKANDGFANTAPVGSFPKGKSRYGIEDVVGNVWEWVADWYVKYPAATASETQDNPQGPASGDKRVARGGAWNGGYPSWVRPTFRFSFPPANHSYGVGFRCAKSL